MLFYFFFVAVYLSPPELRPSSLIKGHGFDAPDPPPKKKSSRVSKGGAQKVSLGDQKSLIRGILDPVATVLPVRPGVAGVASPPARPGKVAARPGVSLCLQLHQETLLIMAPFFWITSVGLLPRQPQLEKD